LGKGSSGTIIDRNWERCNIKERAYVLYVQGNKTMNPETITDLGYITELLYPPQILNKVSLRRIYVELGEVLSLTECKEFSDGVQFVSQLPEEKEIARYRIRGDKIIVHGQFTTGGLELYWRRVETISKKVVKTFKIPIFVSQVCIIRLLATPKPVNDSREFIGNMVCSFRPKNLSFFERPTQAVGLRFYFPHTSTALYDFNVKIESRITDITKIWLENTGRFLRPIPNDNLSVIHDNLSITREFLVKNVTNFLTQYNAKR